MHADSTEPHMLTGESTSMRMLGGYDTIVVGACLLSVGIATIYWIMRIGFDNPLAFPARAVGLALFLHSFPLVSSNAIARLRRDTASNQPRISWWWSYPFLWILAFLVVAILGRLVPLFGVSAFPLLA